MTAVMNRAQRRVAQKHMRKESATYPDHLVEIAPSDWPISSTAGPRQVWRSRDYLVQVFSAPVPSLARLSVNRTELTGNSWSADIPWGDLQRLKRECGFGDAWAVEMYPPDRKVVNVAAMRHIFVVPVESVPFAWGAKS